MKIQAAVSRAKEQPFTIEEIDISEPRYDEVLVRDGQKYIFCSEPCQWIFLQEPERYANHKDIVKRVLSGEAPAQLPNLLTEYFRLTPDTWGKDAYSGNYDWLGIRKNPA